MTEQAEFLSVDSSEGRATANSGSRPVQVNKRTGEVRIITPRGLVVNSLLRKQEWEELDQAVVEAARYPLKGVDDLRSRGLVRTLGGIGTMVSQWNVSSEMTGASISMSGRTRGEEDRVDFNLAGVPIPVVFKGFTIGQRELESSRRLGDGLDTTHAAEATRVVAEKLEDMLFNGATVTLNGNSIYGYRTHPDRVADTAYNFNGHLGGWTGTNYGNVVPTIAGMISGANNDRHYGPFILYLSTAQYNFAALNYFSDGTGDTALARILKFPQIAAVQQLDTNILADGEALLVQMTRDVVDWAQAMDIRLVEWTSGDGMTSEFKVMAIGAPRVKSTYGDLSGVVHATGLALASGGS
jgi:uncharacterized linocin/CFP29 family protein